MRFFLNNIAFIRRIIVVILLAAIIVLLLVTRCSSIRMRMLSEVYACELSEFK
nr:hypothetical protein [Sedimentibacter sp.]